MWNRLSAFLVGLAALGLMALPAAAETPTLNGTTWEIKGNLDVTDDTLVFRDGDFTSTECIPFGFKTGPFTEIPLEQLIRWKARQTNEKNESMDWMGSWDGVSEKMSGSYTFRNESGKIEKKKWVAVRKKAA